LKVVSASVRQTMPDELVKNVTMVTTITQIATPAIVISKVPLTKFATL
jgi:hypothetical protein